MKAPPGIADNNEARFASLLAALTLMFLVFASFYFYAPKKAIEGKGKVIKNKWGEVELVFPQPKTTTWWGRTKGTQLNN